MWVWVWLCVVVCVGVVGCVGVVECVGVGKSVARPQSGRDMRQTVAEREEGCGGEIMGWLEGSRWKCDEYNTKEENVRCGGWKNFPGTFPHGVRYTLLCGDEGSYASRVATYRKQKSGTNVLYTRGGKMPVSEMTRARLGCVESSIKTIHFIIYCICYYSILLFAMYCSCW